MNENVTINNDETRMEPVNQVNENEVKTDAQEAKDQSGKKTVKSVVVGGLGLMAGLVGSMGLMAFREAPQMEAPHEAGGSISATPEPETIEEVEIAQSPEDSMSFNEAFAAAREEVGPNGVFEWRGGIYGTYYADEWESFSDDYKDNFCNNDWRSQFPETDADTANELADAGNDASTDIVADVADAGNVVNNDAESEVAEVSFGEHVINVDENGNQYITLQDAITGEEVRVSPEDLQYTVLDEHGELIGVIGEDILANIDGTEDGYLLLDSEGNLQEFVSMEDDAVELVETDEDGVAILNGADDVDVLSPDLLDDNAVVIEETDGVGIYLADNDMPDYVNDAPVDDFIV
ncbi:hypothetical protein [Bacteroides sp. UBA939]|uniref:hypothetical protein n=1 Tax=Bacteroides sp. UBA939 TaxID=1946092 RepID=UPI0025C3943F|nr:hypothetical protein [Bacteroides sp. UBA939]